MVWGKHEALFTVILNVFLCLETLRIMDVLKARESNKLSF